MKTVAAFLFILALAPYAYAEQADIDMLRTEFRTRSAELAADALRSVVSAPIILKKVQLIARDVFSGHPEVISAAGRKWYEGLQVIQQGELSSFNGEWVMPMGTTGKEFRELLSQVPLPEVATEYYMQGINPAILVDQVLGYARMMMNIPSDIMVLQTYVPPQVMRVSRSEESYRLFIRTVWCEVLGEFLLTPAGVFVPIRIEGRKK